MKYYVQYEQVWVTAQW